MVTPHNESAKHLWRALFVLCLGSGLLLLTKLGLAPFWDTLLCFGGGAMLLYANGEFLFGLLIHANTEDTANPNAPEQAVSSVQVEPEKE